MKSFFKKYGVFIVFIILIIILFINFFKKTPNEKLKKYLIENGFNYFSESELSKENPALEKYEDGSSDIYNIITYDFNNSKFYYINRQKEDGYENVYNLSIDLMNGFITGDYKKENEYDSWYIEASLDSKTNKFNCDTGGYKGMIEYCDFLQEEMTKFRSQVSAYLIESGTNDYYPKQMND